MAGSTHPMKGSSASHHRKSRSESGNNPAAAAPSNPKQLIPSPNNPYPATGNLGPPPPPPPAYGFHMLDRRTIILADGSVRSYLALPPDYRDFAPPWLGFNPPFPIPSEENPHSNKRKHSDQGTDEFARHRQQLLQYGNALSNSNAGPSNPSKYMKNSHEIDQAKLKRAFLNFVRVINENANQKKKYLADGKQGSLQCLACGRSSKDYTDMHSLIVHAYNSESAMPDQVCEHLGLHKALCVLMGWNYSMPPDNSKAYQKLSAEEAAVNRYDLIMWPPHVIIQNTLTGKGRDGRMEGMGNKAMDIKLRDLGFVSGKSKAMYGREGHMGASVVKFGGDESGLKDAVRLAEYFEREKRGRGAWNSLQTLLISGKDNENHPNLVKLDNKTGEKERVLYGYLGTAFDLDGLDFETRKKVVVESKREKVR